MAMYPASTRKKLAFVCSPVLGAAVFDRSVDARIASLPNPREKNAPPLLHQHHVCVARVQGTTEFVIPARTKLFFFFFFGSGTNEAARPPGTHAVRLRPYPPDDTRETRQPRFDAFQPGWPRTHSRALYIYGPHGAGWAPSFRFAQRPRKREEPTRICFNSWQRRRHEQHASVSPPTRRAVRRRGHPPPRRRRRRAGRPSAGRDR